MKVCVTEHTVETFGAIPVGSLWDDDSPYVLDENAACFEQVAEAPAPDPVERPVRKFAPKSKAVD
jgi:hypothetical protein